MNNMKADKESVYRPEMMRKARKCIYKILKNFRVEKSGEISRNLRFSCALALFSCLHLNQTLIMGLVSDLDAKPCVADLDAR